MHTPDIELTPDAAEPTRLQCRHIKTDGLRCRSACLRREQFCYFHHTTRVPIPNPRERKAALGKREAFSLALVEDRPSIQLAIAQILQRIAANELDPRRAGLLLYGLQIASVNLPPIERKLPAHPEQPVEDIVEDPVHGTLAPIGEIARPKNEMSLYNILTRQWAEDERRYEEQQEQLRTHAPQPSSATPEHPQAPPQPLDLHAAEELQRPASGPPTPASSSPSKSSRSLRPKPASSHPHRFRSQQTSRSLERPRVQEEPRVPSHAAERILRRLEEWRCARS